MDKREKEENILGSDIEKESVKDTRPKLNEKRSQESMGEDVDINEYVQEAGTSAIFYLKIKTVTLKHKLKTISFAN